MCGGVDSRLYGLFECEHVHVHLSLSLSTSHLLAIYLCERMHHSNGVFHFAPVTVLAKCTQCYYSLVSLLLLLLLLDCRCFFLTHTLPFPLFLPPSQSQLRNRMIVFTSATHFSKYFNWKCENNNGTIITMTRRTECT